jgi:hypothetical protein
MTESCKTSCFAETDVRDHNGREREKQPGTAWMKAMRKRRRVEPPTCVPTGSFWLAYNRGGDCAVGSGLDHTPGKSSGSYLWGAGEANGKACRIWIRQFHTLSFRDMTPIVPSQQGNDGIGFRLRMLVSRRLGVRRIPASLGWLDDARMPPAHKSSVAPAAAGGRERFLSIAGRGPLAPTILQAFEPKLFWQQPERRHSSIRTRCRGMKLFAQNQRLGWCREPEPNNSSR